MSSYFIFTHPNVEGSKVNKVILEKIKTLPNVEVRELYRTYPDYKIDVQLEQTTLLKHDLIVLQFPLYWYSSPSLLKEWEDQVLTYGFAYGSTGDKLKGKKLLVSITTGGPADAYNSEGYNHFTIAEFLRPLEQTTNLCGMEFLPYISISGAMGLTPEVIARHAEHVAEKIRGLNS
jgi:glutathione-regulated potassium-efflux system ancillary protein KefG